MPWQGFSLQFFVYNVFRKKEKINSRNLSQFFHEHSSPLSFLLAVFYYILTIHWQIDQCQCLKCLKWIVPKIDLNDDILHDPDHNFAITWFEKSCLKSKNKKVKTSIPVPTWFENVPPGPARNKATQNDWIHQGMWAGISDHPK